MLGLPGDDDASWLLRDDFVLLLAFRLKQQKSVFRNFRRGFFNKGLGASFSALDNTATIIINFLNGTSWLPSSRAWSRRRSKLKPSDLGTVYTNMKDEKFSVINQHQKCLTEIYADCFDQDKLRTLCLNWHQDHVQMLMPR